MALITNTPPSFNPLQSTKPQSTVNMSVVPKSIPTTSYITPTPAPVKTSSPTSYGSYKGVAINAGNDASVAAQIAAIDGRNMQQPTLSSTLPSYQTNQYINNQGVQTDMYGDALLPKGPSTLVINPYNSNGAVPSSSFGSYGYSDILNSNNVLAEIQKKIFENTLQSQGEIDASGQLAQANTDSLTAQKNLQDEIDRLMSTSNLTRDQASNFVSETQRQAQNTLANIAIRQNAASNTLNTLQGQRQSALDAYSSLYNMNKPMAVSAGATYINPMTGQPVFSGPQNGDFAVVSDAYGNQQIFDKNTGQFVSSGSTGSGGTGSNAIVDAWAQGVKNGTYKITDVPNTLQSAVVQAIGPTSGKSAGTSNVLNIVEQLLQKNTDSITGLKSPTSYIPGTDAQLTKNLYEQLKSMLSLENRNYLKGSGAISDFEAKTLEKAASSLGTNLSNADFRNVLNNLRAELMTNGGQSSVGQNVVQTKAGAINTNW